MILISYCTVFTIVILLFASFNIRIKLNSEGAISKRYIGKTSLILFAIILIITSTIRYGFIDTYAYRNMYESARGNIGYVHSAPWGVEAPWLYLLYILNYISSDPKLMQLVVAIVVNISFVAVINKYSYDVPLSLWLYYCITYMNTNNGMRQFFALGITMLAFPYLLEKKYLKYILLVGIAALFHTSAIFCLLIWLVAMGKPFNKRVFIMLICGIAFIAFPNTGTEILSTVFSESKYVDYLASTQSGMNIIRAFITGIIPLILVLLYIYKCKKLNYVMERFEAILINMIIMNTTFTIMGTYMQYWSRIGAYFSFAPICLLPKLVKEAFIPSNYRLVKSLMIILYFIFFAYNIYSYYISGDLNSFRIDF